MFSENQKISERQMARLLIFDMCGISTLLLPGLLGKMLGTDGVFAILLGAVPVYLFTFLPELLQEKRKNSNIRNGSNTSNISNIGKSYPEILKKKDGTMWIVPCLVPGYLSLKRSEISSGQKTFRSLARLNWDIL